MTMDLPERDVDGTVITIRLPLPMPVYGTMMKLVGAAYPDAQIGDSRYGDGLNFIIPKGATAKRVSKAASKAVELVDGIDDVDVLRAGPEGLDLSMSRRIAEDYLVAARETFKANPDAVNYVEHTVVDRETHQRYVLIFARSPLQTPHELRMAAEAAREAAERHNAVLQAELGAYRRPGLVNRIAEASAKYQYEAAKFAEDPEWDDLDESLRRSRIEAARTPATAIAAVLHNPEDVPVD